VFCDLYASVGVAFSVAFAILANPLPR